jgi:hypothetical protein
MDTAPNETLLPMDTAPNDQGSQLTRLPIYTAPYLHGSQSTRLPSGRYIPMTVTDVSVLCRFWAVSHFYAAMDTAPNGHGFQLTWLSMNTTPIGALYIYSSSLSGDNRRNKMDVSVVRT